MDQNFVNPYDKEYMRLAILKHEETFKHQVHELHRLYRIQKLLMRNIAKERPNNSQLQTQEINNIKINKLDLERPADDHEDYAAESSGIGGVVKQLIIDESEIELTLGPSNYSSRSSRKSSRKKPDTTTTSPLTSESGATFSSSNSTGSSNNNRLNNNNTTKREDDELGIFQVPNNITNLANNNNYQNDNNTNVDDKLRQERLKQTPWLFQVLSLNLTN